MADIAAMPSAENGTSDGAACGRCGASNSPGAGRCASCQSWLPGNAGAVRSGLYRQQQPLDIRLTAQETVDGILADLGGLDELTTLERAYVSHLSDVTTLLRLMVNDMASRGFFTPGGNPRRVAVLYLSAIDRFDRLGQRIGLKRRARSVVSLEDLLREPDRTEAEHD